MLTSALIAAVPAVIAYAAYDIYYRRFRQYANFPQAKSSFLWGHLAIFGERLGRGAQDRSFGESPPAAAYFR